MARTSLYTPLLVDRDEIRLLDLRAGNFREAIHCDLRHAELRPGLEFTALSYTWGDPINRKPISINDHTIEVTVNLRDALRHMRDPVQMRTFWIDAVCINQADIEERNAQVLRMRDIYSMAMAVEVWMGIEEENDAAALQLVEELGNIVSDPGEMLAKGFNDTHKEKFLYKFAECSPETAFALGRLFKRPWWTRMWVVQEVSLAKQGAIIVRIGVQTVPWLYFLVTAYAIEEFWSLVDGIITIKYPDERLDAFQHGIRLAQCRSIDMDETFLGFTLLDLLSQHRDCAATDPRDKVYGLLGLAGDVDALSITPSYKMSLENIYIDLFRKHVAATESLDMVCAVRFPRNLASLPSWVPDWSTDQTLPGICINDRYVGGNNFPGSPIAQFEKYAAAGDSRANASFSGNALSTKVIRVGTISYLGDIDNSMALEDLDVVESFGRQDEEGYSGSASEVFNNWCNLVLKCPKWDHIEEKYGAENVIEVFCRTLIADRNSQMMRPFVSDEEEEEVDEGEDQSDSAMTELDDDQNFEPPHQNQENQETDTNASDDNQLFSPAGMLGMTHEGYRSSLMVSWGKRLSILDSGHIGIVPGHSVVGDSVTILRGCSMPLVTRASGGGRATVIGESYIHGIMDGELMNGVVEDVILE